MSKIFTIFLMLLPFVTLSQLNYYQDIYKGGFCSIGSSTADGNGEIELPIFIEPGSTIRKIFLITHAQTNGNLNASDFMVYLDGIGFIQNFTDNNLIFASTLIGSQSFTGHWTHVTDITSLYEPTGNSITITWNSQTPPALCPSCVYAAPSVLILYDNPLLETINVALLINNQHNANESVLQLNSLNPADFTKDIVMGIHSDRLGADHTDGYKFYINSNYVGTINSSDVPTIATGVIGNYFYQNGISTGLTDDTPDNIINGSDGLLQLNSYLNNVISPINVKFEYILQPGVQHNILVGLYLAYATPCEPIAATTSNDTTICIGQPLQLSASGGMNYKWSPSTGLSCSNCPNPIFTGDSSQLYTVKISSTDECFVNRPVKVNVNPLPEFSELTATSSICGSNTGIIAASSDEVGATYSLDGSAIQNSGIFNNLAAGNYSITIHSPSGCSYDSMVSVGFNTTVNSLFTATPNSGGAPLTVYLNNQSTNATDYEWFLNSQSQGNSFTSFTFDSTGVYTVTLVAWQNNPSCADTFSVQIHVFDSLVVQVPNVFTANNDGVNEQFGFSSNIPVSVNYQILNRWGNIVASGKDVVSTSSSSGNQFTVLWDGENATEGTYFYKIEVKAISGDGENLVLDGFLELVR